jgi:hypothetical protein
MRLSSRDAGRIADDLAERAVSAIESLTVSSIDLDAVQERLGDAFENTLTGLELPDLITSKAVAVHTSDGL